MSAWSFLLRLVLPLGAGLSLVACGDTARSPASSAGGGTSGQGGSSAGAATVGLSLMGVVDRQESGCSVSSNGAHELLALGTLDRALAPGYTAALLLQSKHPERLALRSLDVSVESEDGAPYDAYSTTVTGFVDAAPGQASQSLGVTIAELVPPTPAGRLEPGLLSLRLTLHAQPLSDEAGDVVSPALVFPLQLCEGCLVSYPDAARDPASPDGSYLCLTGAPAAAALGDAPLPCQLGLDAPVTCATCSDTLALCRDAALNPSR